MSSIIKEQLDLLKNNSFEVDGKKLDYIPDTFNSITFFKTNKNINKIAEKMFIFKDYMIIPFDGFDFNEKFNKGINPPLKIMFGEVLKETDKMYYIKAHGKCITTSCCSHCLTYGTVNLLCSKCLEDLGDINNIVWQGWTPKKSCDIVE